MKFIAAPLAGVYTIELEKREDDRGFFARSFCAREFADHGLCSNLVQINNSMAVQKGTLRGMHYQLSPKAETKIVRCIRGSLYDAIVDLRKESATFGQQFGAHLSADNRVMLYVPKGFAHGFLTLEDNTEAFYLVDEYYSPNDERGVRWNDPHFQVHWPLAEIGMSCPSVISDKDANHPDFRPETHLR